MPPRKILIPLWNDYHLFRYLRPLAAALAERGFRVVVLTFGPEIKQAYDGLHERVEVVEGPSFVKFFHNRADYMIIRMVLWVIGGMWVAKLKRQFDFAIVPLDTKVLWYLIAKNIPSLYQHFSFEDYQALDSRRPSDVFDLPEHGMTTKERCFAWLDKLCAGRLLPRRRGMVVQYKWREMLIDRLFGCRSQNFFPSYGPSKYIGVVGHHVREHIDASIARDKLVTIGYPGYDDVLEKISAADSETISQEVRAQLNIHTQRMFVFFSSHAVFDEKALKDFVDLSNSLHQAHPDFSLVIKIHPKVKNFSEAEVRTSLQASVRERVYFVKEFSGDVHNGRLMVAADCVFMKASKLMVLATALKQPFVVLEWGEDSYELDSQVKQHLSVVQSTEGLVSLLAADQSFSAIADRQLGAVDAICYAPGQASQNIADLINVELKSR